MPSRPSWQAWAKTIGPSPSICSLKRIPGPALTTIDASVALRTSSGSRRRVVAVQFDQVEGTEKYALVGAVVTDEIERGNAVVFVMEFPELMPPTLITRDLAEIKAFRAEHGDIVMKPLYGKGGEAVFRLAKEDLNFG